MEKNMETTIMVYIGNTIKVQGPYACFGGGV